HHDHEAGTLAQDVDAKPPDPRHAPTAVVVLQVVYARPNLFRGQEAKRNRLGLLRRQGLPSEGNQLAVNARPENVPRLDVEVGRPPLYRRLDDFLHAYSSLRLVVVPGLRSAGWPNESARLSTLPACLRGSSAASPL